MIPKRVYLGNSGHEKLKNGIRKLTGAVESTLGPYGETVLMESEHHVGGVVITKDGVSIAKNINLYDPVENLAVSIVKEAAKKTAVAAGDGTTTSIVLTNAILEGADKYMEPGMNKTNVIRHINKILEDSISFLTKKARPVNGTDLVDVATISANNDPELGEMIADVYDQVRVVTVENSKTPVTYSEVIHGMKVDRGWSSKFFVTDEKKEESVLENPYVLLCDLEINNFQSIFNAIEPVVKQGRPLLIIGNLSQSAQNTLNLNVVKKVIKACHIQPPSMGYRKDDLMNDLSMVLGARIYSEKTGDDLQLIEFEGLGQAAKVIVSKDRTIIMRHANADDEAIDDYINDMKDQMTDSVTLTERNDLMERIANISGGVGVIHVGANSDIEQKEKYDRVDDAVRAVGAALEEGILPGGGIALARALENIKDDGKDKEYTAAADIMTYAMAKPIVQIIMNSGLDYEFICDNLYKKKFDYGYDVKNKKYGSMYKMGVIDPALVTKSALKNAVSVATTIMSTQAIITNMREDDNEKN